ncbi:hypothetical protein TBLA_0G01690 [Henningerozyma blattae CBS 6284]|uniref:Uncharacterized protein n=1 Tax=Henningerozyma blattae (strain ATCC 34711 / CBS 6284 / DSM 70876 / NBRC 10599 / NRRL Y-10934 / UCD 77-7) TaxID=1071380 RepID=I2H6W1_HENB6|nr:hypothetical protein TBLA_0G01690 [Tetrapisispora blattae CBS 6284]CCH62113.1 hypothetical protein TBLA_0G01690 [Tetrapisispora blattae CBS 6284]
MNKPPRNNCPTPVDESLKPLVTHTLPPISSLLSLPTPTEENSNIVPMSTNSTLTTSSNSTPTLPSTFKRSVDTKNTISISNANENSDKARQANAQLVASKLRVRLQWALYKCKTGQTHLTATDILKVHTIQNFSASSSARVSALKNGIAKSSTSSSNKISRSTSSYINSKHKRSRRRRKLLVSHGNYKTPIRANLFQSSTRADSTSNTTSNTSTHSHGLSNVVTLNTTIASVVTPIKPLQATINSLNSNAKANKNMLLTSTQQTPISLQAAKSLLHLFSSVK